MDLNINSIDFGYTIGPFSLNLMIKTDKNGSYPLIVKVNEANFTAAIRWNKLHNSIYTSNDVFQGMKRDPIFPHYTEPLSDQVMDNIEAILHMVMDGSIGHAVDHQLHQVVSEIPLIEKIVSTDDLSHASSFVINYLIDRILVDCQSKRVNEAEFVRSSTEEKGYVRFQYLTKSHIIATGLISYDENGKKLNLISDDREYSDLTDNLRVKFIESQPLTELFGNN